MFSAHSADVVPQIARPVETPRVRERDGMHRSAPIKQPTRIHDIRALAQADDGVLAQLGRSNRPGLWQLQDGLKWTIEAGLQRLILEASADGAMTWLNAVIPVSDRSTLGGLTQFATQFGFAGSATSL